MLFFAFTSVTLLVCHICWWVILCPVLQWLFFFTSDCRQVISTIVVGLKKNFAYHTIWVMSLNQFIVTLLLLPVTDLCSFSCYSIIGWLWLLLFHWFDVLPNLRHTRHRTDGPIFKFFPHLWWLEKKIWFWNRKAEKSWEEKHF